MDSLSFLREVLAPLDGKGVLDIGCGPGNLAKSLLKLGTRVTGVDPAPEMIEAARAAVPDATFLVAPGETLPFEDGAFEAAIFLNSLHHVPQAVMIRALEEAARVATGAVVVIEPLAAGTFFAALRIVEDETLVRNQAQDAIKQAVAEKRLRLLREVEYVRREIFDDFSQFAVRITAADSARAPIIAARRGEIEDALRAAAETDEEGRFVLDQPMRAQLLAR
jgi:ubiquinone/menaquinone biosynthesis C-methylase UbiE